jgi:hypothetical protein
VTIDIHDPSTTTPRDIIKRGIFETEMDYFTVYIDDEMAADLLMYNVEPEKGKEATNRKSSPTKEQEYALKMVTDQWGLNPQPIIFTVKNGKGVIEQGDGQQRLKALRLAAQQIPDICLPFVVCVDAPLAAKMVVDQGKMRTLSDWLRMRGETAAAPLTHAVKMLYCFKELQPFSTIAAWRGVKLTPMQQEEYLLKHPAIRQALVEAKSTKMLINPYVGAVLWYLMREEYGPFIASEFMDGIAIGANLDIHDPRLKLRNYLSAKKLDGYPWDGFEQLGLLITAANAHLRKSTKYTAGSAFKKTDKTFPKLTPKADLPEELFTREGLVSLTLEEMESKPGK